MKGLIETLEDECRLRRYAPPRFHPVFGLTSGKSNRKQPRTIAYKWIGPYLVTLKKFEGRCLVEVTDESKGYSKKLATATGLEDHEAEDIFQDVCETLRTRV